MKTLAFDCSTTGCSVAIIDADGTLLSHHRAPPPIRQAEALLPLIAAAMATCRLAWAEIGLIGVSVGPGSFTGLRIGLAAARGLGLAGKIPLIGVSTAEIFAHAIPEAEIGGRTILVAIDGKRTEVFVQLFSERRVALGAPTTATPDQVPTLANGPLLLAGDGAGRVVADGRRTVLSSIAGAPDAAVLARRAYDHFVAGDGLPVQPLYLRPPDVTVAGPSAISTP
jgi:tRNA threonylcarbamoyladenosine biosynthesis protein TsaB